MSARIDAVYRTTVFWLPTGFRVRYAVGVLIVNDLNPEQEIRVRLSRWEAIRLGARLMWGAMRGDTP